MISKTAILLVNLGTPDAPEEGAIRKYLKEFLSDPRIIDLPPLARKSLLNFIILPKRPARVAPKYQKIWMPEGSPLMVYGSRLLGKLRPHIHEEVRLEMAMRYGNPSIKGVLSRLIDEKIDRILIVPLFPQYASATSGSVYQEVFESIKDRWFIPAISVLPPFFKESFYIHSMADLIAENTDLSKNHLLFSYHSLPEKHLHKTLPYESLCMKTSDCCSTLNEENHYCYRAQCFETSRLIADKLGLTEGEYTVSFQSRLGKEMWLQPETGETIEKLALEQKDISVCSPSFLIDCLETLEELGVQERNNFQAAGGRGFSLIPSLNDSNQWVKSFGEYLQGWI